MNPSSQTLAIAKWEVCSQSMPQIISGTWRQILMQLKQGLHCPVLGSQTCRVSTMGGS